MTKPTILLVEDNPMTRKLVRFALERDGCELLEAPDRQTALRMLDSRIPDLVLQDLCLPDADGFALIVEIRAKCGPDVPILCFSGFISKEEEAHVAAAGFDGVVSKPVEPSRLVQIVRGHLPPAGDEPPGALVGRTIVLADDDPLQLKLLHFRLSRMGCVVIPAADGTQALALARDHSPDAIVSDVMMPGLDGFALAMAVRSDPALAQLPVILVTSTYVEPTDRDLARRAGASEFVLRTPDLRDVVNALRVTFETREPGGMQRPLSVPAEDVERERATRVQRQLERQVSINVGLAQRSAMQAAELTVLTGITEAVVQKGDLGGAIDDVLALCFDAGGVSVGALYLLDAGGEMTARVIGGSTAWKQEEIDGFFGHAEVLREFIARGRPAPLPGPSPADAAREILARSGAVSAHVFPLVHSGEPLGAMFVMSRSRQLDDPDWLEFTRGVANQLTLAVALTRSIKARAASEAAAVDARSQLRAVFDNAPDFVCSVDRSGCIQFANRALSPHTDQVAGMFWLARFSADQHPAMSSALESVFATGQATNIDVTRAAADGTPIWLSCRIAPVRRNGDISGAVLVARDVTEKKRTDAQLIASDRMASVGILAAGIAHEINNPLAAVMANLELAFRDVTELTQRFGLPSDLQDEIHDARLCAERIRTIVRDLKIFSRAEDEKRGPVDTRRVLESTLRMVWNEIRHRARLVKLYGDVPPVEANESRLGQVFLNLVVNAAHAIPEGRAEDNEIRVSTRLGTTGDVVVEIADTGSGMSADVQRRIFTPFFTTKPVGVGTGLGLAICQRIVTDLGGTIDVESEIGRGTTFRVNLPRARTDVAPIAVSVDTVPHARRRGRILVIDDEPILCAVIRRALMAEHDVDTSTRAQEAIDRMVAGERFDVILCDLMMPDVTGMDLHAALVRLAPDQAERVLFMTGGAFTAAAREFLDRVPTLRFEKPFARQELRALVNDRIR